MSSACVVDVGFVGCVEVDVDFVEVDVDFVEVDFVDVDFVDDDVGELVEVGVDVVVGGPLLNLRRKF